MRTQGALFEYTTAGQMPAASKRVEWLQVNDLSPDTRHAEPARSTPADG